MHAERVIVVVRSDATEEDREKLNNLSADKLSVNINSVTRLWRFIQLPLVCDMLTCPNHAHCLTAQAEDAQLDDEIAKLRDQSSAAPAASASSASAAATATSARSKLPDLTAPAEDGALGGNDSRLPASSPADMDAVSASPTPDTAGTAFFLLVPVAFGEALG